MEPNTRTMLAENVRRLRLERGWTQTDLAIKAGVCQTNISSLERAFSKSPRLDTISGVAAAFGLPDWALLQDLDKLTEAQIRTLGALITTYTVLPPPGQAQVQRVAEAEERYAKTA